MADLARQLEQLARAVDLTAGRVPDDLTARALGVLDHADRRLAAGPQTVVALGGATGSGKSSLFNALSGTRLAQEGARRPTTSRTLAVSFSATNSELLDLLGVVRRREAVPPSPDLADVVLLDLPDHDSTVSDHRVEVDRMVRLVDQFVWVLDPQKYADAAIFERYLRPLAGHSEVMTVVLNHADLLTPAQLDDCLAHLRRILDDNGLAVVTLRPTSAVTGMGVGELRAQLGRIATGKRAAAARLAGDVAAIARELHAAVGPPRPKGAGEPGVAVLVAQLSAAAGVPVVVDAVRGSVKHRGHLATGWPMVSWVGRLRPDPLKRLRLGGAPKELTTGEAIVDHSSLPARSASSGAQLAMGLREVSERMGEGLPPAWARGVFDVVRAAERTLSADLDHAVVTTDLKVGRTPAWWHIIRATQWVLIAAVAVGALWLTLNAILNYFGLPPFATYPVGPEGGLRVPMATVLVLGGVVAGIALSGVSQLIIGASANGAARRARKALEASVAEVARERVLAPAEEVVAAHAAARRAVDALL
ncbi:MAG: 50S ribosome-binding GTPase [Tessaracoccus sp.]|uniref:GTPase n=1 Tax=Tessaracoccus sp. TaxID=1971211 RepID=UPI001ED40D28|nr:GTPase [Tessaracoccus sp.]MBK7820926.1 50S ribosome-binding GTPase [Tessaracoccus sp.]